MSQAALAVKMGVDRAHVSSMERGQQNVTIITLWHAALALDVRPHLLLKEDAPDGT
ncbi:Transcriptional regulator, XRE family [Rhodovulum sp. P5]|nr:Transcriptional regulator, XRE family [Rhodovulum sp. P5]